MSFVVLSMNVSCLLTQSATTPTSSRSRRVKRVVILGTLLVCAWAVVAWIAARLLIVNEPLEHADAIAVLSGSSTFEERAQLAAALYKEGRAPRIILTNDNQQSGWSPRLQRNPFYWERASNFLQRSGVPRESIEVLPELVDSTYAEAVLLQRYCQARGWRSILVVTSPYHSRRARWTLRRVFENSGVTTGIAAVPPGQESPRPVVWWLHRQGWRTVAPEFVKLIYYHSQY